MNIAVPAADFCILFYIVFKHARISSQKSNALKVDKLGVFVFVDFSFLSTEGRRLYTKAVIDSSHIPTCISYVSHQQRYCVCI